MANELLKGELPNTMAEVEEQLEIDGQKYGETWRHRDLGDQDRRIADKLLEYIDQYRYGGQPLPYRKIAGLAHIALTRKRRPDLLISE